MRRMISFLTLVCICGAAAADESQQATADDRQSLKMFLSDCPHTELTDTVHSQHCSFRLRGWMIHLNEQLWVESPEQVREMLPLLSEQLKKVADTVPTKALETLQTVPVWINPPYSSHRPRAEYHPAAGWLRDNKRNPAMARGIELTNVAIFPFECRRMPALMLHELAHAYHHQVLGFDHPSIVSAYESARRDGTYESVERFNGRRITTEKAYAMSNAREYFAETTEALFGRNDFFPFDREQLRGHDPQMYGLLRSLWGVE